MTTTDRNTSVIDAGRWWRSLALLGILAMLASAVVSSPSMAQAPPANVVAVQPVDGNTAYVARVAPRTASDVERWQLKLDVWLSSATGFDLTVDRVFLSYPGSSTTTRGYEPYRYVDLQEVPGEPPIWDEVEFVLPGTGSARLVPIFDGIKHADVELNHPGRELSGEVPETVVVEITFEEVSDSVWLQYDLEVYENDTPTGGLLFPAKAADLAPGVYWEFLTRHTVHEGGWPDVQVGLGGQRYALDMGAVRFHNGHWTPFNALGILEQQAAAAEDRDPEHLNHHFLVFGLPVHAMATGVVTECLRGLDDHPFTGRLPAEEDVIHGAGNHLVIDHGDEVIGYAHLRANSIPEELCPGPPSTETQTGLSIPVTAGQQIGQIGNTGNSTAPHIHFDANRPGNDGVPLNFMNVQVAADPTSVHNLPNPPPLHPSHGATLPANSLVLPNPCGVDVPPSGAAEYARHGVPGACWQDEFNLAVTAGYRPVYVDAYEDGGSVFFNAVFRPGAEIPSIARHGLTGGEYQDLFHELTAQGWRLHQVDSYLSAGQPRIAAIFEQRPGPGWAAHHLLSTAEHTTAVQQYADDGLVPVNVSWVEIAGQRFWTALFEHHPTVTDWEVVVARLDNDDYQDAFDARVAAGRALVDLDVQLDQGVPYATGVFAAPFTGGWTAVHGLYGAEYQDAWEEHTGSRLTRAVAGGVYGGVHRFAAFWRGRPDTAITSAPPSLTNVDTATFTFVASDPYARFDCTRGTAFGPWEPCTSPTTYTDLPEGTNTFRVRAVDRESVRDPMPAAHSWFVDTVPPEITLLQPAENHMYVHDQVESTDRTVTRVIGSVTVVAHVIDPEPGSGVASVTFLVNGVPVPASAVTHDPATDTWSFLWRPEGPGKNLHTITVVAVDHATNSASASRVAEGTATGKSKGG